jgi:hypothetical protein
MKPLIMMAMTVLLGLRPKTLFDRAREHQPPSELIRDSNGHRASGARVWVSVVGYTPA